MVGSPPGRGQMENSTNHNVSAAFGEEQKRPKLDRTVSMNVMEKVPLSLFTNKYKTAPMMKHRWRSFRKDSVDTVEDPQEDEQGEYHRMQHGESPPVDDLVFFESLEDVSDAISVRITREMVRQGLVELLKSSIGNVTCLENMAKGDVTCENAGEVFNDSSVTEKNIAFLWAAFIKRSDLVEWLHQNGAELQFSEPKEGYTALHLCSFSGCIESTRYLISQGADVNMVSNSYTPLHSAAFGNSHEIVKLLLDNGAKIINTTEEGVGAGDGLYGSALNSAVKANAFECIQLLLAEGADVNYRGPRGAAALHVAADLGHSQGMKLLLDFSATDINIQMREKLSTPLHLAADSGFKDCVCLLLSRGADPEARNLRGQTALQLACKSQSIECVELLLKVGGCDPNAVDNDDRTPLHSAVGKATSAYDIAEILISWGAKVNCKDKFGYTPLHIAALNELSACVETLIYHGADASARSKGGTTALSIIVRKTPTALAMLYQKLDYSISLHDPEVSTREVELKLDFRNLLQHCQKGEISFLKTFVDEGQKEILEHPLCEAFLYLKWQKIRKYYIARMLFCLIYVLMLSIYILTALAHQCYNESKGIPDSDLCANKSMIGTLLRDNPSIIEIEWYVLVFFTLCETVRKFYGIAGYSSIKQYISQLENVIEWFVIASVFIISCVYHNRTYTWQNHVGAFAVLFGWSNLMVMIGQLPVLGSYVAMYTKVQKEFLKLLTAYSCLLIGFTISFCVVFPDSDAFSNPFLGFIKVLVMMTGELEYGDILLDGLTNQKFWLEASAHIIFVLFLLFVTVILMNLLVGIAVHDIQGLQKTARLSKLVRQTKLISYIELALFNGYLPGYILGLLQWAALVSPSAYRVVLHVKPLNPRERRLPPEVLKAAYKVAKQRKRNGHTTCSKKSCGSASSTTFDKARAATMFPGVPPTPEPVSGINTLSLSVEEGAKALANLAREVDQMKEMLRANQEMMKELLQSLNKRSSDC